MVAVASSCPENERLLRMVDGIPGLLKLSAISSVELISASKASLPRLKDEDRGEVELSLDLNLRKCELFIL